MHRTLTAGHQAPTVPFPCSKEGGLACTGDGAPAMSLDIRSKKRSVCSSRHLIQQPARCVHPQRAALIARVRPQVGCVESHRLVFLDVVVSRLAHTMPAPSPPAEASMSCLSFEKPPHSPINRSRPVTAPHTCHMIEQGCAAPDFAPSERASSPRPARAMQNGCSRLNICLVAQVMLDLGKTETAV